MTEVTYSAKHLCACHVRFQSVYRSTMYPNTTIFAIICHWSVITQAESTTFSKTWMNRLYWQFVTPKSRREQQTKMSNAVVSSRMRRFSRFFSILLISGAIDVDDFTYPSLVFSGTRKQHQRGPVLTPADIALIRKIRIRGHFHLHSPTVSKLNSFIMLLFTPWKMEY